MIKKTIKRISIYSSCLAVTMMLCACPDPVEEIIIDNGNNNQEQGSKDPTNKVKVELTYSFGCDEDLIQFVTPVIVYTDKDGLHEIVLDDKAWSPTLYAYCYYTENGTTHYSVQEPDKDGHVPEPWIIESTNLSYNKKLSIQLEQVGVENVCKVKYNKKSNYTIDPSKEYDLSRSFGCTSGSATFVNGGINVSTYTGITINLGTKSSWKGNEVEDYINELCSNPDVVTMTIDEKGKISEKK